VDDSVGRILEGLESLSLADNTVVCFASDHGELLGDHGMLCKGPFHYEGLLRVPRLWSYPGGFPAGRTSQAFASLADFAPTVLDLAGVTSSSEMHGLSLARLLRGATETHRDGVLTELHSYYRPWLNVKTWREEEWKLTYYAGQPYG